MAAVFLSSRTYCREFKKDMEEKDKRIAEGMQVLKMLRTARIVWANPASEVFLAGSFDGWTSWVMVINNFSSFQLLFVHQRLFIRVCRHVVASQMFELPCGYILA